MWALAGNVAYAAAQALSLFVIARMASSEALGRYVLALAITTPVFLLTNLQLRGVLVTDACRDYQPGHYVALRILTSTGALLVVSVIAAARPEELQYATVLLTMGLAKAIESLNDVLAGVLHSFERMREVSVSLLFRSTAEPLAMALGLYATGDLAWAVLGVATTRTLVLLFYDIPTVVRVAPVRPNWRLSSLRPLAQLSAPLGLTLLLIALGTNIPRYFIAHHLGNTQLGIYGAMFSLTQPGVQLVSALGQAASPRLARLHATGNHSGFWRLLRRLLATAAFTGGTGVAVAAIGSQPLLTHIYGSEYASQHHVLIIVMAAATFTYLGNVLGIAATATRHYHRFVLPYLTSPLAALAGSWAFVPGHGLDGAALATCAVGISACVAPVVLLITATRR